MGAEDIRQIVRALKRANVGTEKIREAASIYIDAILREEGILRREEEKAIPATMKQKRFMDDLGVSFEEDVSKEEAQRLIQQKIGR